MDIVLGVSMTAPSVHMVLVEGMDADGVTVDEDGFDVGPGGEALPDRVVSAILGTRESAQQGGYRLTSTGVTVTDQRQADRLRNALANRRVENVMLVSAFLAAAALAQTVGGTIGYRRTALMFIEPDSATLAVVDSDDGSITEVRRVALPVDDAEAVGRLTTMAAQASLLPSRPDGMLVVGSGVNVSVVKPELEAASPIPVSVPEEPETALARGAALASAHAPLFDSSTSALAWARDPGTGVIDPDLVALGYAYVPSGSTDYDATRDEHALAYSAVDDDDSDDGYRAGPDVDPSGVVQVPRGRRPFLLAGSALAAFFVVGVAALVVALAVSIRPTAAHHPVPDQHIVAPVQQEPAPAPKVQQPAPAPAAAPVAPAAPAAPAPAPAPAAPVPAPAPAAVAPAPAPVAVAPTPAPVAPAPAPVAPAPAPAAPAPAPVAPAPAAVVPAPIPIPIPIQIPAPAHVQAPAPIQAPAPSPPAAQQPQFPWLPSIFNPAPQTPPKSGGGQDKGPSWLPGGNDHGHDSTPSNPWLPDNSGGGHGGGSPWFPGLGGGRNGGGGLFPGLGGGDQGGDQGGGNHGGWGGWGNWGGGDHGGGHDGGGGWGGGHGH